jgi:hypothetical protein
MTGLDDEEYAQKGLVEPRYMGTLADRRDMNALGRVQVLRVSCSALVMAVVAVLLTLGRETFGLSLLLDLDAL